MRKKQRLYEICFGKWHVDIEPVLDIVRRSWPTATARIREEATILNNSLNLEKKSIERLTRESTVAESPLGPIRRYRISTPAGWLRLLFVIDVENCTIIFVDVQLRDEETYKRVKRKWR